MWASGSNEDIHMIPDFHHSANEIFALLGCYRPQGILQRSVEEIKYTTPYIAIYLFFTDVCDK